MAAKDRPTELLQAVELEAQAGRAVDCRRSGVPVGAARLDGCAERWPRFTGAAAESGFCAVCAAPVRVGDQLVGVLSPLGAGRAPLRPGRLTAVAGR